MIKGFLFDLDGVIVDTAVYHFQAWRRIAQKLGGDFSHEQNEQLKGVSRHDSLVKIVDWTGAKLSKAQFEALMELKNEWYLELVSGMGSDDDLPGAIDFIKAAADSGIRIALGSASKNAPLILDKLGISYLFDAVIDGNNVINGKPHPEVFLKGAAALGLKPEECLVFEDSAAGIDAAIAGGMKTVGVGEPQALPLANIHCTGIGQLSVRELLRDFNA